MTSVVSTAAPKGVGGSIEAGVPHIVQKPEAGGAGRERPGGGPPAEGFFRQQHPDVARPEPSQDVVNEDDRKDRVHRGETVVLNPRETRSRAEATVIAAKNAETVNPGEAAEIAVAQAGIDNETAKAEAAKAAAAESEEVSARKAISYASDRVAERDPNVPANEQFRVAKAMRKSDAYKKEMTRLVQEAQQAGEKPNRQRMQQFAEQAARKCYYAEAQRQIEETKGEVVESVRETAVFRRAFRHEMGRAEARARLNPGETPDLNDITTRALTEVLIDEAMKKEPENRTMLELVLSIIMALALTVPRIAKGSAQDLDK